MTNIILSKENYINTNIKICYPQITNYGDSKKEQQHNDTIKTEALKVLKYYQETDAGLSLEIGFEVKRIDELLSIQYSGLAIGKGAAHPNNLFYTTNIDLKKGAILKLKDLVQIDDILIKKFTNGQFKAVHPKAQELASNFSADKLFELFNGADSIDNVGTAIQTDTFSYLTDDSLGISLSVGHAAGDHVEFEIKYQDIADNIKF